MTVEAPTATEAASPEAEAPQELPLPALQQPELSATDPELLPSEPETPSVEPEAPATEVEPAAEEVVDVWNLDAQPALDTDPATGGDPADASTAPAPEDHRP